MTEKKEISHCIMTKELMEKGRSSNGMWSMEQINLFGLTKFNESFPKTVLNKSFPTELIEEYLALKDKHLKK